HEAVAYLTQFDIPCAPVLSMKEISLDPSLRQSGSVVEVEQPLRGKYLTVGCPMKFSAFTPDIKAAPILLSLINLSEPTRRTPITFALFCLTQQKKKKKK
ncbi:CoA transferase, partial [Escherichia coli]|uniref:CoA transferase n=1 Tax=Escherichia coli TaxID=562 RepID=UPI002024A4D1